MTWPFFSAKTVKTSDDACTPSEFKFPAGCSGDACEYHAIWIRNTASEIEVEVRHKVDEGKWTAIGFSENNFMVRKQSGRESKEDPELILFVAEV